MRSLALTRLWSREAAASVAAALATVLVSLLLGIAISRPDVARIAVAVPVAFVLATVATISPRWAAYGLVTWLVLLGLLRRLLTSFGFISSSGVLGGDPLLLVGPVLLAVLFIIALQAGALRQHTPLSRAVLGLTVVLAMSAFNPLQGGLSVGLGGLLLVVVPMLAFWVGRSLLDERTIGALVTLLGALCLVAAIYGLVQTVYGFPSWDQRWITESGYTALRVNGVMRAFATSSSASEYAAVLGIGILSWRAIARHPLRLPIASASIAVIAVALWLESSRGIVVLTVAALGLTFAASRGVSIGRALLLGAVLVLLLPTVVGHLSSAQSSEAATGSASPTAGLEQHQIEGLKEPLGKNSTLGVHFGEVLHGITQIASNPLGRGVGATTIAATKFDGTSAGTEADPGNAPIAAGIIGLILYLLVAFYGLKTSYQLAQTRRTMPAIAALGILIVTFLQWLNGGQYATIPLVWLLLGWADAASRQPSVEMQQPALTRRNDDDELLEMPEPSLSQ